MESSISPKCDEAQATEPPDPMASVSEQVLHSAGIMDTSEETTTDTQATLEVSQPGISRPKKVKNSRYDSYMKRGLIPPMNWNDMFVTVLAQVFKDFEMRDLLSASEVCRQWSLGAKQRAQNCPSLLFLLGSETEELIEKMRFAPKDILVAPGEAVTDPLAVAQSGTVKAIYPKMDNKTLDKIANYFENVKTFKMYVDGEQNLNSRFLGKWETSLTTVAICIRNDNQNAFVNSLFGQLNSLQALENLSIVLNEQFTHEYEIEFSCLARLKSFKFDSPDSFVSLVPSLVRYVGENSEIKLDIRNPLNASGFPIATIPNHVAKKFENLKVNLDMRQVDGDARSFLVKLMRKFTSLKYLSLDCNSSWIPINDMARVLSPLQHLTHLKLVIYFAKLGEVALPRQAQPIEPLRVKYLTLEVDTKNEDDLNLINFRQFFPSVERVKFVDRRFTVLALCSGLFLLFEKVQLPQPRRFRDGVEVEAPVLHRNYDFSPEARVPFIRRYLQSLKSGAHFGAVDIYQRTMKDIQHSNRAELINSYTADNL